MRKRRLKLKQADNPKTPDPDAKRTQDGRFGPGNNANPSGWDGHLPGFQKYGTRIESLQQRYTPAEILELNKPKNAKKLFKLGHWDVMIVRHLSQIYAKNPDYRVRESLLDRTEGKPKQTTELTGTPMIPPIVNVHMK